MPHPDNFDFWCAQLADKLFQSLQANEKAENHVQKSMGILQEDGLYAFAVFQDYRASYGGEVIKNELQTFLSQNPVGNLLGLPDTPDSDFLSLCRTITGQTLDRLFLARDLILRILVYVYYHLRASSKTSGDLSEED